MPALPDPTRSRAVLIGCATFAALPPLPAVRHNLTDLRAALTRADTGVFAPESCVVVDSPRSPSAFMAGLRSVADQAEDLLLVYYAGHGLRHDTHDELHLAVRETDPNGLQGTTVLFDWIRDAVQDSPARTKLVILDCCYSGVAIGAMGTVEPGLIEIGGTTVLTSSPSNRISHSPPGEYHTAFSGELISLLVNGPALERDLTVQVLYRGLRAAMARRQLPPPKLKSTDTSGELVLRRAGAVVPPPTPQPPPPPPPKQAPTAVSGGWLATLWTAVVISAAMLAGGLIGYFWGVPPPGGSRMDDLSMAMGFLLIGGACLAIVCGPVAKRVAGRAVGLREAVRVTLLDPLARWSTTWLAVLAGAPTGFTITLVAGGNLEATSTSVLAFTVGIILAMVLATLLGVLGLHLHGKR